MTLPGTATLPAVPLNDLSRALAHDRSLVLDTVARVVDSGWLVHGPAHRGFESALADYLGTPHVLGVASGTDALEIALRAVVPADRPVVVTAANCGGYTTTAARRAGFGVRYADVDEDTHLLTAETLAPVLGPEVGAVVVTHLYGRAADVAAVRALCAPLGVKVVEDCAQALGARRADGMVGALADVATFSFYPTKNLGALGDGGAVATADDDVAAAVAELRQYGWRGKYRIARDGGRNSRLDEVQAAVLSARLPHLDAGNARRRAIITAYAERASSRVRVLPADDASHAGHLAVVTTDHRDELREHLAAAGVGVDVHYPVPDHRQPALAAEHAHVTLPVTERLAASVLSVPVFPELRDDEVERVCDALERF
ncbi:DegT/DnrJ/EryC1/StrS family aminotransferase [Cellulomonas fimi]|uniref:DegT/DnrJ/EryC1/StrS family aminotransferase n=1 Tax=Cellulomonas fimi TaxID=1708 RepID=UPI0023593157|nr:DegT/DnrJ/EryC1/StrS family aminotransferase [Cellulomonas fimi]